MRTHSYLRDAAFAIDCGFDVDSAAVAHAAFRTNEVLASLPFGLYRSLDYKTTSAIVGSVFCGFLAEAVGGIVNPIEKGHPDILPVSARSASEASLRNYPTGLEIKTTVGGVATGANLRAGEPRVGMLTGITWQAHHREVTELLALVWDFVPLQGDNHFPAVSAAFYSNQLEESDWGTISGTTGRNTKVTGMTASGKRKMAEGTVLLIDRTEYICRYVTILGSEVRPTRLTRWSPPEMRT